MMLICYLYMFFHCSTFDAKTVLVLMDLIRVYISDSETSPPAQEIHKYYRGALTALSKLKYMKKAYEMYVLLTIG